MGGPTPPAREYTRFQQFVLTYLYAEELEKDKLKTREIKDRITMGIHDFIDVTPGEILPESELKIREELYELMGHLLLHDVADKYFLSHTDGQIYVKK